MSHSSLAKVSSSPLHANTLAGFFASLSMTGLVIGFLCFYVSLYPMLLPRVWWLQAIGSALSGAIGYSFGKMIASGVDIACLLVKKPMIRIAQQYYRMTISVLLLITFGFAIYRWLIVKEISALMDMPSDSILITLASTSLALVIWLMLIAIGRWLVLLVEWLVNLVAPKLNVPVRFLTWLVISVLMVSAIVEAGQHYVWQPVLQKISQSALKRNQAPPKTLTAPTSPFKSGFIAQANQKPAQTWEQLGHYGQRFVSLGLSASEITEVTGRPALEPIRVFVGLANQEPSEILLQNIVKTAIDELDRTHAWQRKYIVVQGATGRGWVEEYSSLAAEYLTDGDIASVVVQYSYLPSQVSFLMDRMASSSANTQLIEAIEKKLATLPKDQRPKLILAGESLGAFATQSAFKDENDLVSRIDGAVWVGTPRLSRLWETLVANRQSPSTESLPVINHGKHIRFMDYVDTLTPAGHPQGQLLDQDWQAPRIVFLQHALDPIVWWSTDMLWQRPDWMHEQKGRDVVKIPTWLPLISLGELTLDMPASSKVPAGHGHIYQYETTRAWQAVLDKSDISADKINQAIEQRIKKLLPEKNHGSKTN
ncbi:MULTISPECIES: alpha/beta-hydrolase family protein [unclassified Acinetobacter]|uniref:alpha/beta-hydrolase family protein n=1 Tax=unclassified Acinetobacter TaxID=196816 RepID=UPI0035BAD2AE